MVPILVILTFACFILIDIVLEKRAARRMEVPVRVPGGLPIPPRVSSPAWGYALPGGVFLHPGHTWAYLELSGEARVGIDDFAGMITGKIDHLLLPEPGKSVRQGEKLLTLVKGERRVDFASPLDGVVHAVNGDAVQYPGKITSDPYRSGWILELRPTNLIQNLKRLRLAAQASEWFEKELMRFSDFIDRNMGRPAKVGATARDGGTYLTGVVEKMDDELFEKLVRTFLRM